MTFIKKYDTLLGERKGVNMRKDENQVVPHELVKGVDRTLVVDTATAALTVALFEESTLVADVTLIGHKQHGERLVDVVSELMEQAQWQPQDVTQLAVGVGPGSYTGVRVGVTFAKTWAVSQPVRLMRFSSLALMASLTKDAVQMVIPLMDARRMSAYVGVYQWQSGRVHALVPDAHVDWVEWLERIAPQIVCDISEVTFIGEQVLPFVSLFTERFPTISVRVIEAEKAVVQAATFSQVELEEVEAPTELVPVYAHLTVAEQEWLAKQEHVLRQEEQYVEYL